MNDQAKKKIINTGAINQPIFFPWPGYFHIISRVEKFIFLDHTQFQRDWGARNYILSEDKEKVFINIRVKKNSLDSSFLDRDFIDYENDFDNLKKFIENSYSSTKYYLNIKNLLNFNEKFKSIGEFNMFIIERISKLIGLKTNFFRSSEVEHLDTKRSELVIKLCNIFSIKNYLSSVGSKSYMEQDNFKDLYNGTFHFSKFISNNYNQNSKNFVPNLSILDLISNNDLNAVKKYVISPEIKYWE
jgi:hypothetical protein